ncbi:hypothetical protein [Streptomyces xanthophaeus]|uniref:hypothetical protein n=1 Tax=Streptomyces xanthophaeus TaxID=67385 RepID=UPI0004CD1172|nr:hypothetical protein [Streptomyces xanthophaeus]
MVDWSWGLLTDAERALLRRLAAFPGGATVEAAEAACVGGPVEQFEVLDLITSLVDKSLLVTDGDGRYRMLETIKAYGLERLAEAGEAALAQAERDAEAAGWPEAIAATAHGRAELARWRGESAVARAGLDRVQEALREVAVHAAFRAMVLDSLAHLDAADGHLEAARARRAEALEMAVGTMHAPTVAQMLVGVADQAVRLDRPEEAARLLAAALAVRGGPDLSLTDAGRVEEAARATLGAAYEQHAGHGEPDGSDGPGLTMEAVRELARVTLGG